jgi:hypothetical protein
MVRRVEHHYIQSNFMEGRAVVIEHRRGGPDLQRDNLGQTACTTHPVELGDPNPGWEKCLSWQRVEIDADT